jgi:dienelactone hydrolase
VTSALLVLLLLAPSKAEAKLLDKVAKVWVDYAKACTRANEKDEALRALAYALDADPGCDADGKLKARIEAIDGEPRPSEARRKTAHRNAAKIYDKLAKYGDGHMFRAIELEPTKKRTARVVKRIRAEKDTNVAGGLLARLRSVDPEGDYSGLEIELGRKDVVMIGAKDHPIVGWLALPKNWSRKKRYPVLVTVDGAGSNFLGACRASRKRRGSREWIILAPCTFANTNSLPEKKYPFYDKKLLTSMGGFTKRFDWDHKGLTALLAVVRERFGGEEKIAITGFSGGGNLCYGYTLLYPQKIRFAVPACANFAGLGANPGPRPENGGPPIRIFTGANDPHREWTHGKVGGVPGIEPQTDNAQKTLRDKGYTNVTRKMLPGVRHSSLPAKVWEVADELAGK